MPSTYRHGSAWRFTIMAGLCVALAGCDPTLESRYADPRGTSINGVYSFVQLLRQSDHKVDVWPAISPRMQFNYQTLIVFQSSFEALPSKVCREIEEMLVYGTIGTLVIVARDSDAKVDYWRQMRDQPHSSTEERDAIEKSYHADSRAFQADTLAEFDAEAGTWFGLKRIARTDTAFQQTVECESHDSVFSVEARWPLNRRLEARSSAEVLWKTGDDPLLTYEAFEGYEVFVMGSATPLLNGGLVDPGNRQLAAEFARQIPCTGRVAIALSSEWFDDSEVQSPSMIRFLQVHPNGWVFGQGIVALLLFCWSRFPIFGRPRESSFTETARFGRHVDALGNLLRRTGDVKSARQRIRDWFGLQGGTSDSDSKPG